MAEIKSLEHSTLKVPYEILNKKFRAAQKIIDREVSHVQNVSANLESCLDAASLSKKDVVTALDSVVENLSVLKRKAGESIQEEVECTQTCKRRVDHLKPYDSLEGVTADQWKKTRLDRMLVEYFLRSGYYNTAIKLAKHSNIEDLTNINLFLTAKEVEDSLQRRETGPCLVWCYDNKSKLRKIKSTLEFNIRQQEFIELIRDGKRMDAVRHVRKYISGVDPEHKSDIQTMMGLLVYSTNTTIPSYQRLLDPDRWTKLIDQFREVNFRLHQLNTMSVFTATLQVRLLDPDRWTKLIDQFREVNFRLHQLNTMSVFTATLQVGLSALKTHQCYKERPESCHTECPICSPHLNQLARPLPFSHSANSKLVCYISGEPLNEDNPPMMMPNGYVYSTMSVAVGAAFNNNKFVCPRTKQEFGIDEAEKLFIM